MNRADHWLSKFSKLHVDRARGDHAPHKPLLLLVLCDQVEKGNLPRNTLPLTPELAFRFYTYWSIVAGRRLQRPAVVILRPSLSFRSVSRRRGISLCEICGFISTPPTTYHLLPIPLSHLQPTTYDLPSLTRILRARALPSISFGSEGAASPPSRIHRRRIYFEIIGNAPRSDWIPASRE